MVGRITRFLYILVILMFYNKDMKKKTLMAFALVSSVVLSTLPVLAAENGSVNIPGSAIIRQERADTGAAIQEGANANESETESESNITESDAQQMATGTIENVQEQEHAQTQEQEQETAEGMISRMALQNAPSVMPARNGDCGGDGIESSDGTYCLKASYYSAPGLSLAPITTSVAQDAIAAPATGSEGVASSSLTGEGQQAIAVPTVVVPTATAAQSSFTLGAAQQITITETATGKEIQITPKSGLKIVVDVNTGPVSIEKNAEDGTVSISSGDVSSTVASSDTVKVDGSNISVSGQEVKVMPDIAVAAAAQETGEASTTVQGVELGTMQGDASTTAAYQVTLMRQARMLGLFAIAVPTIASVNAQSGAVVSVSRPWWSFLAF